MFIEYRTIWHHHPFPQPNQLDYASIQSMLIGLIGFFLLLVPLFSASNQGDERELCTPGIWAYLLFSRGWDSHRWHYRSDFYVPDRQMVSNCPLRDGLVQALGEDLFSTQNVK